MSEASWQIGRMEVSSPWGNAGGVVQSVEELEMMARTGVGWIEPGSYTAEKRYGNQKDKYGKLIINKETGEPVVVYHHDVITGETTNSLGMPGQGIDQLVTEVPEMLSIANRFDKGVVFNVAPVTDNPAVEVYEMVSRLVDARVKRILINLGCPNVVGEDGVAHETLSYHPDVVGEVLAVLKPILEKHPDVDIYVRTSPDEDEERNRQTQQEIIGSGVVRAVWLPNTWPLTQEERANSPLGVAGGGRSGSSARLIAVADRQLTKAMDAYRGSGIDVVMSTSIRNADRLKRAMDLGAVAGAGTTFYYETSEHWTEATDHLLREYLKLNGEL